jgi:ribosomal protein S14
VFEGLVYKTLKSLGSVSQAEGHERKFKKTERCGNCTFLNVIRINRNLMISPHEINFRKECATGKVMGVIMYVWKWVSVGDGANVQGSIISTGPPTAVLLRHEMES